MFLSIPSIIESASKAVAETQASQQRIAKLRETRRLADERSAKLMAETKEIEAKAAASKAIRKRELIRDNSQTANRASAFIKRAQERYEPQEDDETAYLHHDGSLRVFDAEAVVRSMPGTNRHLTVESCCTNNFMAQLAYHLPYNKSVTGFWSRDNFCKLTSRYLKEFTALLTNPEATHITELGFNDCKIFMNIDDYYRRVQRPNVEIDREEDEYNDFCHALATNTTLERLSFSANDLQVGNVSLLAQCLVRNNSLWYLNLANNPFGIEGIRAFFEYLDGNTYLQELNFSNCGLTAAQHNEIGEFISLWLDMRPRTFLHTISGIECEALQARLAQKRQQLNLFLNAELACDRTADHIPKQLSAAELELLSPEARFLATKPYIPVAQRSISAKIKLLRHIKHDLFPLFRLQREAECKNHEVAECHLAKVPKVLWLRMLEYAVDEPDKPLIPRAGRMFGVPAPAADATNTTNGTAHRKKPKGS